MQEGYGVISGPPGIDFSQALGRHSSSHYSPSDSFASTGSRRNLQEKKKVSLQTGNKSSQLIWQFSFSI
jgi:hypothetical protein